MVLLPCLAAARLPRWSGSKGLLSSSIRKLNQWVPAINRKVCFGWATLDSVASGTIRSPPDPPHPSTPAGHGGGPIGDDNSSTYSWGSSLPHEISQGVLACAARNYPCDGAPPMKQLAPAACNSSQLACLHAQAAGHADAAGHPTCLKCR
jgi:hypothetical protein